MSITLLSAFGLFLSAAAARPGAEIVILGTGARVDYPVGITFSIEAESESQIRTLELESGLTGREVSRPPGSLIPKNTCFGFNRINA